MAAMDDEFDGKLCELCYFKPLKHAIFHTTGK